MTTCTQIEDFLAQKRLAIIGVSRNPKDFTRTMFEEFQRRDYVVSPVNPGVDEIDGHRCYARVCDIESPVDGALLMIKPAATERVVRECEAAGIRRIWMYRAAGRGAVSPSAVRFCEVNGMSVIAGECPFMFLPATPWLHRLHGLCRKLTGSYPA